jgi:hypothetical protein
MRLDLKRLLKLLLTLERAANRYSPCPICWEGNGHSADCDYWVVICEVREAISRNLEALRKLGGKDDGPRPDQGKPSPETPCP